MTITREELEAAGRRFGQQRYDLDWAAWDAKQKAERAKNIGDVQRAHPSKGAKPLEPPDEAVKQHPDVGEPIAQVPDEPVGQHPDTPPPATPMPAEAQAGAQSVMDGMKGDEQKAMQDGYAAAQKEGFAGSPTDFLAEQVALYQHAPEGDPRVKTFFYGDTLQKALANPALASHVNDLVAQQKGAGASATTSPTSAPSASVAAPTPKAAAPAHSPHPQHQRIARVRR
jgi:hypothetical protein